jgi:hypothetical protein
MSAICARIRSESESLGEPSGRWRHELADDLGDLGWRQFGGGEQGLELLLLLETQLCGEWSWRKAPQHGEGRRAKLPDELIGFGRRPGDERDASAWPDGAMQLRQSAHGIRKQDDAENRERSVEARVAEGQTLAVHSEGLDHESCGRSPLFCSPYHRLRGIDGSDSVAASSQLQGCAPGSGSRIQNVGLGLE